MPKQRLSDTDRAASLEAKAKALRERDAARRARRASKEVRYLERLLRAFLDAVNLLGLDKKDMPTHEAYQALKVLRDEARSAALGKEPQP